MKCESCGAPIDGRKCEYCDTIGKPQAKPKRKHKLKSDHTRYQRIENVILCGDHNRIDAAVGCVVKGDHNRIRLAVDTEIKGDHNKVQINTRTAMSGDHNRVSEYRE